MARSVYNVDFYTFIGYGNVLCENGDASFPFEVVVVEDELVQVLGLAHEVGLIDHPVHERGLAVVHMGDDGDISDFLHTIYNESGKDKDFSQNLKN